jgi:hypothetical protein
MKQAISKQISESKAKAVLRFRRNQAMRYNSTMEPLPQTDEILQRLAEGEGLATICRDDHMPSAGSVHARVLDDAVFADRYARARRIGLDVIAEQIVQIAADDKRDANSRRVEVDARKWLLSKLRPDKYGDRLAVDARVEHSAGAEILAALRQRRGAEQAEPAAIEAAIQRED